MSDMNDEAVNYSARGYKEEETFNQCPTCGKEAEGIVTCPRCGARVTKSIPLDTFKLIAAVGMGVGFVLLLAATYFTAPTLFKIGEIGEIAKMLRSPGQGSQQVGSDQFERALDKIQDRVRYPGHLSYQGPEQTRGELSITVNPARLRGRVADVRLEKGANNFTLTISDGEQEVDARGFNALSDFKQQLGENFPPDLFDRVQVVGSLNISSRWGASMYLSTPSRLQIVEEFEEEYVSLADITRDELGNYYWVKGKITDIFRPGKIRIITVEDLEVPGVKFELAVPDFMFEELPSEEQKLLLNTGNKVEIFVQISEYQDNLQLSLADPDEPGNIRKIKGR